MRDGRLRKACAYLDESVRHTRQTMFDTTMQRNSIAIMFGLLKELSPALDSDETDTIISEDMFHPSVFGNVFCKYITVLLDEEKYGLFCDDITKRELVLNENDNLLSLHLKARRQISMGEYGEAVKTLRNVIDSEVAPQRLLLYLACADMEICCRETNDYKGAYEFSQNKLEIFEHLLSEEQ